MHHAGKRLIITGIPTSGKSYLANMLAEKVEGIAVSLDHLRIKLSNNNRYKKWVNFYLNQDEKTYLLTTNNTQKWDNLVTQSEKLWPAFLREISKFKDTPVPVIFESVNLLPHLVQKDLGFNSIILIGSSFEETLKRNQKNPRWGNTAELQELEARMFFYVERPHYKEEALKCDFPVFEYTEDAMKYCINLLR